MKITKIIKITKKNDNENEEDYDADADDNGKDTSSVSENDNTDGIEFEDDTGDRQINDMIINRNFPPTLMFLENEDHLDHYNEEIHNYIINRLIPHISQWDIAQDDLYYTLVKEMRKEFYNFDEIYYGLGCYLILVISPENLENEMNKIRKEIIKSNNDVNNHDINAANTVINMYGLRRIVRAIRPIDPDNPDGGFQFIPDDQSVNNMQQNFESVKLTVPKDELNKIKLVNFKEIRENIKQQNFACVVCQCEFADNDKVRETKCGHVFHRVCIDKWLLENSYKCPICRSAVADHIAKI